MSEYTGWKQVDISNKAKVANAHIFGIAIIAVGMGVGLEAGKEHCKETHPDPTCTGRGCMTDNSAYTCLAENNGEWNPAADENQPTGGDFPRAWVFADASDDDLGKYGTDGKNCETEFKQAMEGQTGDEFCVPSPSSSSSGGGSSGGSSGSDVNTVYNPNLCMCKTILDQQYMGIYFRFGPYGIMLLVLFAAVASKCCGKPLLPEDYSLVNLFVCRSTGSTTFARSLVWDI